MKIETLDDLIAVSSGCCCAMPACPIPSMQCESIEIKPRGYTPPFAVSGSSSPPLNCVAYAKRNIYETWNTIYTAEQYYTTKNEDSQIVQTGTSFSSPLAIPYFKEYSNTWDHAEGSTDETIVRTSTYTTAAGCVGTEVYTDHNDASNNYSIAWNTCPSISFPATGQAYTHSAGADSDTFTFTKVTAVGPPTGESTRIQTVTYSERINLVWITGKMDSLNFDTHKNGAACSAYLIYLPECDKALDARKTRFRWQIPVSWLGTYFKITWDILEEPDGWDDPSPTVFRSFYLTDQTWVWTGPGNTEDAEDASWFSPWHEIPLPSVSATRRIVNIRFECYSSARIGNKPQVTGEAIADDEL